MHYGMHSNMALTIIQLGTHFKKKSQTKNMALQLRIKSFAISKI
jgi:hypothetical protein